jgi:hypothetical protein
VDTIVVQVARPSRRRLALRYAARGDIGSVVSPLPTAAARVDELWRHTCFEVFLRGPDSERYIEFNLSPSSQWAAYAFDGYRTRAADPDVTPPAIRSTYSADLLTLATELDLSAFDGLDGRWQVGLSAVIEDKRAERSYWALAHPPGQPDFHHKAAFTLRLPPPDRP